MPMDDALALARLVDMESRTKRNLRTALAAGNARRAEHFRRRLAILDDTIGDRSLAAMKPPE